MRERLEAVRQVLGPTRAAAAWSEGRSMALAQAIRLALEDGEVPSVERAPTLPSAPAFGGASLTLREQEVERGMTNRQIAGELAIAERTAKRHVEHILQKLGGHTRTQVATWAVQHGLGW